MAKYTSLDVDNANLSLHHCKGQLISVKVNHVNLKMWFRLGKLNLDYFRQL